MTLRGLLRAWNEFFFAEQSPTPIALFRVFYGVLVIVTLILLRPDWQAWYGVHGWVTLPTASSLEPGTRLNLFSIIPQNDTWIEALFWVSLGSAILLTVGFLTRLNTLLVFLCLTSIQQRNLYITHGGDTFLRLAGFFLIFAPAGAVFFLGSSHSHMAAERTGEHSTQESMGATDDSTPTGAPVFRLIPAKNEGSTVAARHCPVLCVSPQRTQALSSSLVVFSSCGA